jgi:hypothetical protein
MSIWGNKTPFCKNECKEFMDRFPDGVSTNFWLHCPLCGAELVDKETELKEALFEDIIATERATLNGMNAETRKELVEMLISKYEIKKK